MTDNARTEQVATDVQDPQPLAEARARLRTEAENFADTAKRFVGYHRTCIAKGEPSEWDKRASQEQSLADAITLVLAALDRRQEGEGALELFEAYVQASTCAWHEDGKIAASLDDPSLKLLDHVRDLFKKADAIAAQLRAALSSPPRQEDDHNESSQSPSPVSEEAVERRAKAAYMEWHRYGEEFAHAWTVLHPDFQAKWRDAMRAALSAQPPVWTPTPSSTPASFSSPRPAQNRPSVTNPGPTPNDLRLPHHRPPGERL